MSARSKKPASLPSKDRALSKRELLLDAAWRLFYRDGFHAVGIDTVLAEAGVAKMTLYNHFPSKEDLIVAVLERRAEQFEGSLAAAVEAAGSSPMKRLMAVFDWHAEWLRSPEFNGCAFIKAVAEYPQGDAKPHQVAAAHKQRIYQLLESLLREIGVPRSAVIARQLELLIEGAIVSAHVYGRAEAAGGAKAAARSLLVGVP
ncbi:TetR/AcrR family transcriptional regulator [Luteolibacter luteus]|uniref:TetR/AcrR family transcriptional regulator n=1 Tax=Luteolibacter luteus TaxID=2728835 RepID=A0A858RID9_9BACT|nr:TetR/AcrR family transcriptional regulator [Luteolibacter luteus]QJE96268.1 TetR/AcrR family transcriptional regulator [Luteolibacter luteus]